MKTIHNSLVRNGLCLAMATAFCASATSVLAVAPPSVDRPLPIHVREAQREISKSYGSNRIAQRVREHQAEVNDRRAPGATASQTTPVSHRIPILLGNYSTVSHFFAANAYNGLFSATAPPGVKTVQRYYNEVSGGQFGISTQAFGPYTAPQTQAYYVNGDNGFGTDYPTNAGGFVEATITNADTNSSVYFPAGVNFGDFDNDGPDNVPNSGDDDGFVDGVFIVVPDGDASDGDADNMWGHQWSLSNSTGGTYTTNDNAFNGGKIQINEYVIVGGEKGNGNLNVIKPIGLYCHEWGHILGLPDLYDTDNSSLGVGTWCLMGLGSWGANWNNTSDSLPVHMSAWCKVDLGWETPTVVSSLDSVGIQVGDIYKLYADAYQGGEYFLVEMRDSTPGTFDAMLPAEGLLIWHCNDNVCYDNSDDAFRVVDLEEADGLNELDSKTDWMDAGDMYPWGAGTFNDASSPSSKDAYGAVTGVQVSGYAMGPGPTIFTELVPQVDSGFTLSYQKHAWISGWGFSPAQTDYGAVRFVTPQAGDLVQVLIGAFEDNTQGYSIRIYANMSPGGSPVAPLYRQFGGSSMPGYNSPRHHIVDNSINPLPLAAGDTVLVDVAWFNHTYAVPMMYRTPISGQSFWSDNGFINSYINYTDKDVAVKARLKFGASFVCPVANTGDLSLDGNITSADVILLVNYVFKSGATPQPCEGAGDVNCNLSVTSADIIALVNFVFKGGAAPCDVCPLIQNGNWSCP
jgi:M6 family metalloprotease-like protein